jgi:hypothetical protein
MIVRDRGGDWQVVLQTDHADLSGGFARAWADRGGRHDSLTLATDRHDDGWAVWERAPRIDPDSGKPVDFLEVHVPSHIAFYRACIVAVTEQDPYAGLMISMHGTGIYRQRYGRDPGLPRSWAPDVEKLVDAFVAEQEAEQEERVAALRVVDDERWSDYERLQIYDRLSLYFCMRDLEAGEAGEVQGFQLEPIGPWHVRMAPFAFGESPARFSLLRRVVPKNGRPDVLATPTERVEITVEA